jgi:hypothetical protein
MQIQKASFIGASEVSVLIQLILLEALWSSVHSTGQGDSVIWSVLVWSFSGAALLCALHIIRRGSVRQRLFGICLAVFPALVFLLFLYIALEQRFRP